MTSTRDVSAAASSTALDPSSPPRQVARLVLAVLPLLAALAIVGIGGGLLIPHNDAWAFSKVAQGFAEYATFTLVGWTRPGLIGQTLLAAPLTRLLPNPLVAQQLTVWVLAVLLAIGGFLYFRPVVGHTRAASVAAITALFPGLGLLSTSFMSDVPGAALGMLCLLTGARSAETLQADPRRASGWLGASMLLGWLAATSREQALAAPAAVLLVHAAIAYRRPWCRRAVLVAAGAFGAAFVAAEWWRRTLPSDDLSEPFHPITDGLVGLVQAGIVLGVAMLPVTVLLLTSWRRGRPRRLAWSAAVLATAAAGVLAVHAGGPGRLLAGNYLGSRAPYLDAGIGSPPSVLPPAVLAGLGVLGAASVAVLVVWLLAQIVDARRAGVAVHDGPAVRLGIAALFAAFYAAGLVVQTLVGQALFDRYLLPLIPVVAGLLIARMPIRFGAGARVAAGVAAGVLAVVSVVTDAAGVAHDTARWHAAESIVAAGVDPKDVAAGLEWSGWHATAPLVRRDPTALTWWSFPGSRDCWVVSGSPLAGPDLEQVAVRPYARLLVADPGELLIYRDRRCRP